MLTTDPSRNGWRQEAEEAARQYRLWRAGVLRRSLSEFFEEERRALPPLLAGEPGFRFDPDRVPWVGQGNGGTKKGEVVGRLASLARGQPGEAPGPDYPEEEGVTAGELLELLGEEFELDRVEEEKGVEPGDPRWEVTRTGPKGSLARRQTLSANLRRRAGEGRPTLGSFRPLDRRFYTCVEEENAAGVAVLAMRDVSASTGGRASILARSFFFWTLAILRKSFPEVEAVFVVHHVRAKEVGEAEFFAWEAGGGTRCSSAYRLAKRLVEERFAPRGIPVYAFHLSDGDNLPSDNADCLALAAGLARRCRFFAYVEVAEGSFSRPTLARLYARLSGGPVTTLIRGPADLYPALRKIFGQWKRPGGS